MKIFNHNLKNKVLIIAEIGNNHEGNFSLAKKMIKKASEAGVDAVKFQSFAIDNFVSKSIDPKRYKLLNKFKLDIVQFQELKIYANKLGLIFISTPLDLISAKKLKTIVNAYKVASGDINFFPMLDILCKSNKPVLVSTGVSSFIEIKKTINYIKQQRSLDKVVLLHCVSSYPCSIENVNLNNINFLKKLTKFVGYSDHTIGKEASLCAVAMGARVIEKHFTMDHNYSNFRDHRISANPKQLTDLVKSIRKYEKILGNKNFSFLSKHESISIKRSISYRKNLKKGTVLRKQHLYWLRPGGGLSPGKELEIIGKKLKCNVSGGTQIKKLHLSNN